ncbi:hypothetical protein NFHSH190041_12070 [Shewanella sp. NFH-SH190041]|nr:hypothetical protein NFHSH190041_12070 [Shewanella sp. NFH-SH190041]
MLTGSLFNHTRDDLSRRIRGELVLTDDYGPGDSLSFRAVFDNDRDNFNSRVQYHCQWLREAANPADNQVLSNRCNYTLQGDEHLQPLLINVRYAYQDKGIAIQQYRYSKRMLIDHKHNEQGRLNLYADHSVTVSLNRDENGRAYVARELTAAFSHQIAKIEMNFHAFAQLSLDGKLFTWGRKDYIGSDAFLQQLSDHTFSDVVPSLSAFAALDDQGRVFVLGALGNFIDVQLQGDEEYDQIAGNRHGIALKTVSGKVCLVTDTMTLADFSGTCKALKIGDGKISKFIGLDQDHQSFVVLTDKGELLEWGRTSHEYFVYRDTLSPQVKAKTRFNWDMYHGVLRDSKDDSPIETFKDVIATEGAYALLTNDDTVITWGSPAYGGDKTYSYAGFNDTHNRVDKNYKLNIPLEHVKKMVADDGAFAALTEGGDVITWGSVFSGGNTYSNELASVRHELSDILDIQAGGDVFSVIKNNGKTFSWKGIWHLGMDTPNGSAPSTRYYAYDSADNAQNHGWVMGNNVKYPRNLSAFISNGTAFMAASSHDDNTDVSSWGYQVAGGGVTSKSSNIMGNVTQVFKDTHGFTMVTDRGDVYLLDGNERGALVELTLDKIASAVVKTRLQ